MDKWDCCWYVVLCIRKLSNHYLGYVYMVSNPSEIFNSDCQMSIFRKVAVYFLMLCMLGMYGIVYITPAIFLSALFSILVWMFQGTGVMVYAIWFCCIGMLTSRTLMIGCVL